MESLGSIALFVLVAETRSFTQAGKRLGISSSGVGKSIGRLERTSARGCFIAARAASP